MSEREIVLFKIGAKIAAVVSALALVSSCAATSCGSGGASMREAPQVVTYRLGPDDELRVIVFGEDDLSGDYTVSGQGLVALPLIGDVNAAGSTLSEFEDAVEYALKQGYLNVPRVSVQVLNYRPYYILGEVNTPAQYPYVEGLSVLNAVAIAGGFSYRANQCRVSIRRSTSGTEEIFALTPDTLVQPGDTIRLLERIL